MDTATNPTFITIGYNVNTNPNNPYCGCFMLRRITDTEDADWGWWTLGDAEDAKAAAADLAAAHSRVYKNIIVRTGALS